MRTLFFVTSQVTSVSHQFSIIISCIFMRRSWSLLFANLFWFRSKMIDSGIPSKSRGRQNGTPNSTKWHQQVVKVEGLGVQGSICSDFLRFKKTLFVWGLGWQKAFPKHHFLYTLADETTNKTLGLGRVGWRSGVPRIRRPRRRGGGGGGRSKIRNERF